MMQQQRKGILAVLCAGSILCVSLLAFGLSADAHGQFGTAVYGRITDQQGAAIPEATVSLYTPELVFQTESDEDGKFEIRDVGTGTFDLEARARGFRPKLIEGLQVTANGGERVSIELSIAYVPEHCGVFHTVSYTKATPGKTHLSGVVGEGSGASPIADSEVWVRKAGQTDSVAATRTNEKGEFEFGDLEPGRYTLGASRSGYETINTQTFWVTRENQTRISVQMTKAGFFILCA
jgi:hypothetical protein